MTLNIVLDIVVAGLLLATIAYAMLLSRRLGALRNDKQQLEALVSSLDASCLNGSTVAKGLTFPLCVSAIYLDSSSSTDIGAITNWSSSCRISSVVSSSAVCE